MINALLGPPMKWYTVLSGVWFRIDGARELVSVAGSIEVAYRVMANNYWFYLQADTARYILERLPNIIAYACFN